ncbi:MAG: hypothetical protein JNJ58_04750 [Chitinophagaceae bacterium]|nr:hypothetical protein [Chitinophagaceae bacterium]
MDKIRHEFVDFSTTYRIGILCYFTDFDAQDVIGNYKKKLEQFGYECDVLMYVDNKVIDPKIFLQTFSWEDLEKKTQIPHSPRTDRFIVKKYDLLFNLFFEDCPQLIHLANQSQARCRVGPFNEAVKGCSDILIPITDGNNLESLIIYINKTLNFKPYERKQI